MYLESLKIYGFKSFADEVKFTFDPGMTSIVGPNGCGKSNVLDAINWVLGEQSPSRLRGDKMEDMIFMGSKSRKPIGISSVEFCVDNSMGVLPVDYEKVSVTRKLYRSGESEYYINRNPCRLKDIKELFMDTGVGTQSYSVMGQGDVSFILKCSPQERRGIIEEAAGIRKYKERKESAKRRLDRTRSDLEEVKNILAEVKKNIRRLKRQTAKARRFRKYKDKLSHLEVSRLCHEYRELEEKLDRKSKQSGQINEKVSSLSASKSKLDAEVSSKEDRKSELDDKIISLSRRAFQLDSKIEITSSRVNNFDSELKRLENEIRRNEETKSYCRKTLNQLKEELKDLNAHRDKKTEEELEEIKGLLIEKKKEITAKEEKVQGRREKIENTESALSETLRRWNNLKSKSDNLLTLQKNLFEKSSELKGTVGDMKENIKQKTESLENLKEKIFHLRDEIGELRGEIDKSGEKISDLEIKREKILEDFHKTKSEFDSGKKYLPKLLSIESLDREKIGNIDGPLSTILEKKLSPERMKEISCRAGEKISWMIAKNRKSAEKAVGFLKQNNLPPLTFILTDKIPRIDSEVSLGGGMDEKLKKIINFITQDTRVDKDLILTGECIISGGGELPPRAMRLLGLEEEIKRLSELLKSTESELEKERKSSNTTKRKIEKRRNQLEIYTRERNTLEQEISNLDGRTEVTEKELNKIRKNIDNLPDKSQLVKKAESKGNKIKELRKKLEKEREEFNNLQEVLSTLKAEKAALEAKSRVLSESAGRSRHRRENVQNRISQTRRESERLQQLLEDLKAEKKNIISRNSSDIKKLKQLQADKKKIQSQIGGLEQQKSKITDSLKKLKKQQHAEELQLQRCKDTAAGQRQTEEVLRERIKGIRVRLKEDMDTEADEALKGYSGQPVSEEEIEELKDKIGRIGNVNLEAPEEFEKENQRFEFIKKHVDDLEEADRNLKRIIRKINSQTRDRFLSTFKEVNKNFNRVFNRLFEGGKAGLELIEPDNILESGLEITARPEGKKISSLKQLSGGERALSAIALMFAVFEVKPSPFCILDEVDSPLDDVNLHRFLKMLKDYSQDTQFILITHNKQTMQESDTFYGITMEEFGVSKVISVNLKQVKSASG